MAWEYRVIHINVDNNAPPGPPDPRADSARLGGALSPEFLQKQFPQQYDAAKAKATPRHPAEQLQFFLNALGKEGWEMVEAAQVGPLLMFFFKRPLAPAAPAAEAVSEAATAGQDAGLAGPEREP
jgi:hypothetical protein